MGFCFALDYHSVKSWFLLKSDCLPEREDFLIEVTQMAVLDYLKILWKLARTALIAEVIGDDAALISKVRSLLVCQPL